MKILLVDDDPWISKHIGDELRYFGNHSLIVANSVSTALSTLENDPNIACIILDVAMPPEPPLSNEETDNGNRTGLVLGKYLKERHPMLPVIGITVHPDEFVERWFKLHADGFFTKPLDPKAIARHLRIIFNDKPPLRTFIVHGHDDLAKLELKNFLQSNLGLPEPVVLHELPSRDRSIIEKLEEAAQDVDVIFVLLTPDDKFIGTGGEQIERARQNVILELGFFLGRFGRRRGRVVLLYRGSLDIPSDISRLAYINIEHGVVASGEEIRRELKDYL